MGEHLNLTRRIACALTALTFACAHALLHAQAMPLTGEWQFTVETDLRSLPEDVHNNFPVITYEKCIAEGDLRAPAGFGLQMSPRMGGRCDHGDFAMEAGKLSYTFQCDGGSTLSGSAVGSYSAKRVELTVITSPRPVVRGVETVHQKIRAIHRGKCKN
jgi:hypothetical protein